MRSQARLLAALPGLGVRDRPLRLQLIALADGSNQDWVDLLVPQLYARYRRRWLQLFPRKGLKVLAAEWRF